MTTPLVRGLHALGPRKPEAARTWAAVMVTVATVTSFSFTFVAASGPTAVEALVAVVLCLNTGALVLLPASRTDTLCVLTALPAVVAITVLDLGTRDAGISGQVFFFFPVLYAATQLRVPGVVLVTASAVLGEALVVFALLPRDQAVIDVTYLGTTLTLTASVLARAGVVQDRLVARLRRQAAIDPLTGLVTRRVLDDATQCAIAGAGAQVGTSLVLIDVDHFKLVNDTHGHVVGDDALSHVAAILTAHSRPADVVARLGGDELAVLMPGCPYDVSVRRAENLVAAVGRSPLRLPDGTWLSLSVSVGAAHVPEHATDARDLYATADAALYEAKRGGRGRVGQIPEPGSRTRRTAEQHPPVPPA